MRGGLRSRRRLESSDSSTTGQAHNHKKEAAPAKGKSRAKDSEYREFIRQQSKAAFASRVAGGVPLRLSGEFERRAGRSVRSESERRRRKRVELSRRLPARCIRPDQHCGRRWHHRPGRRVKRVSRTRDNWLESQAAQLASAERSRSLGNCTRDEPCSSCTRRKKRIANPLITLHSRICVVLHICYCGACNSNVLDERERARRAGADIERCGDYYTPVVVGQQFEDTIGPGTTLDLKSWEAVLKVTGDATKAGNTRVNVDVCIYDQPAASKPASDSPVSASRVGTPTGGPGEEVLSDHG